MGGPVAAAQPTWDLLFILGNLHIPVPTPFNDQSICLCAGNDPIVQALHPSPGNATAQHMLGQFRTQFGAVYTPACLLVRRGARARVRQAATLRAFRNCCAAATVLPAYRGGHLQPAYSDHFDIYPLAAGHSGMIVSNSAITQGIHPSQGFQGQSSPSVGSPTNFVCRPSARLLERLLHAWNLCYLSRRRRRELVRLYRSLEIAMHAARFPTDSLLSEHDAGLRLVLWVSAFEVLLHPGAQRIRLPTVLATIRGLTWQNHAVTRQRYPVLYAGVPPVLSLPEAIYYDLYMARNDFAHGNRLPARRLWFRRDRRRSLLSDLAPLLYWKVLDQGLDVIFPRQAIQPPPNAPAGWLQTARGAQYMQQHAARWQDFRGVESALLRGARR